MQNFAILSSFAMAMPVVKVTNQTPNLLHLDHQILQFFSDTKIEFQSNRTLSIAYFVNQLHLSKSYNIISPIQHMWLHLFQSLSS